MEQGSLCNLNYQCRVFSYNERKLNDIPLDDIIYKILRLYLVTVCGDILLCRFIKLCS